MVAVLVVLGVELWIIGMVLALMLWNRTRVVRKTPGIFACKLRAAKGDVPGLRGKFGPLPSYAHWVHDVLVAKSGLGLVRTAALPVAGVASAAHAVEPSEAKRLGERPQLVGLRLDGDAVVEVAAAEDDASKLVGPFSARTEVTASPANEYIKERS